MNDLDLLLSPYAGLMNPSAQMSTPAQTNSPMQQLSTWMAMQNRPQAKAPAPAQPQSPQGLPLTGYSFTPGLSTAESDAIFKRAQEQRLESRKQQEAGLGDIDSLIAQLEGAPLPTGLAAVDLTPFAAAVDMLTGSNTAQTVSQLKKPETEQERKARVLGLKQMRQKSAADLTDKDLEMLKLQLNSAQQKEMFKYGLAKEAMSGAKTPTQAQFDTAGYAQRLRQSEEIFNSLSGQGYDRTAREQSLRSGLFGEAQTPELKSWSQAERNFINAVLRRESGASISPNEFESAEQQYFPRPGDTPEVLAQKAANRRQVFENLKAGAGVAYEMIPQIGGLGAKPAPKEGDTYEHQGKKYKVIKGVWKEV